jgi:hypothetical protein
MVPPINWFLKWTLKKWILSGKHTKSHGIDGPFIDDFPSYKPPFMVGIFHGYVE